MTFGYRLRLKEPGADIVLLLLPAVVQITGETCRLNDKRKASEASRRPFEPHAPWLGAHGDS